MKRNLSNVADTARSRKKAKLQDARAISTQSPDQALKNGQLDVASFVKSREYEIEQLNDAMLKSKSASSQRAFQSLPRSLRRRAASHNVKRMPKRLRKKTLFETRQTGVPTKPKTEKPAKYYIRQDAVRRNHKRHDAADKEKLNETTPGNIFEANQDLMEIDAKCRIPEAQSVHFKQRQKSKTWLPTHIWHAKRAHIDTLWGFSIPTTPSDKCYRSTHRIQSGLRNSAIAFDTSYYSTVILTCCSRPPLQTVIRMLTNGKPSTNLYTKGTRTWQGILYKKAKGSLSATQKGIGPGIIYWNPYDAEGSDEESGEKHKVMIRVHPANFNELWDELVSLTENTGASERIHIQDCRFAVGSIDIFGTSATNALASILKPRNKENEFSKRLFAIRNLENPDSLPSGTVLNLEVCDPRLQASRPPKVRERRSLDTVNSAEGLMQREIMRWTNDDNYASNSGLFSSRTRKMSYKLQRTLKAINQRRHEIIAEGSTPDGEQGKKVADPSIPVILMKRDDRRCGWSLLAPWHWILPFWFSLMSLPSVKFGGLQESHQLAFEAQIPFFPDDFPGLESGYKSGLEAGRKERDAWEKRPPGKRIAYSAVDCGNSSLRSSKKHGTGKPPPPNGRGEIGDPFICDWGYLNSLNEADGDSDMEMEEEEDDTPIETKKEKNDYERDQLEEEVKTPWMIEAKDLGSDALLDRPDLSRGIFQVCLSLVHRGTPLTRGRVYAIPSYMNKHWFVTKIQSKTVGENDDIESNKKLVPKPSNVITKTNLDGQQIHPPCPPPDYLIGFVTTGCFSLSEGKGQAIGSLGWTAVESTCGFESPMSHYCLIRNSGSSICRLATWRVIS